MTNILTKHFEAKKEKNKSAIDFDDLSKRVDHARGLLDYKSTLEIKRKWIEQQNIDSASITISSPLGSIRLDSHVFGLADKYQKEERLLNTLKYVFEKSIEMELEKVETELKLLNVGI